MIIDAHHHPWRPEHGYTWLDAPELAAVRRPFTPADLTAELAAADVPATVARHRRLRGGGYLAGVRSQVQGEPDPDYLDRPDVRRGPAALAAGPAHRAGPA
ncbi:hypothetical protein [Micromonospora sp. HUAS LYJ1]|uniref:hypothetical protein n=1 Tax=Micromonospora sp. HUAS LYJ1 TaxID=3061626 RepID=UPI002672C63A|nr:hypothetical protein [Micromonospora sp. HUAS LYJ1]WKU07040.1 hypothetical protein Q2K16_08310 [Micromonospora sp. HUAS LYJ1]